VSRRYRKALSGATLSVAAFASINASAKPDSVRVWTAEEENSQRERVRDVKVMDIYDIKTKRCESGQATMALSLHQISVPSRAEILLELTGNEIGDSRRKRHATWIGSGLKIQETQ
jgi:hypothetical protein